MSEFLPWLSLLLYIWNRVLWEVIPMDVVEEAEVCNSATE